jgi:hypothetical protein
MPSINSQARKVRIQSCQPSLWEEVVVPQLTNGLLALNQCWICINRRHILEPSPGRPGELLPSHSCNRQAPHFLSAKLIVQLFYLIVMNTPPTSTKTVDPKLRALWMDRYAASKMAEAVCNDIRLFFRFFQCSRFWVGHCHGCLLTCCKARRICCEDALCRH